MTTQERMQEINQRLANPHLSRTERWELESDRKRLACETLLREHERMQARLEAAFAIANRR
jgi:hypothetical protein